MNIPITTKVMKHCHGKSYKGKKQEVAKNADGSGGPIMKHCTSGAKSIAKKKDKCYYKAKAKYSKFPSAYASGYIAKCRKRGGNIK